MNIDKMQDVLNRGGAVSPDRPRHTDEPTRGIQKRRIGHAAQHLVAADILLHGYDCSVSAELLAYDLIADINGLRRVQVKCRATAEYTSTRAKTPIYQFQQLRPESCDLFAFVILPARLVLYRLPSSVRSNFLLLKPQDFSSPGDSFLHATQYWRSNKYQLIRTAHAITQNQTTNGASG